MKQAANTPARSRSRKKPAAPAEALATVEQAVAAPSGGRNVDPLEGQLSVAAGALFVIAALFPRSLKQLVMLSLGGGLLYRGLTGHCSVYQSFGIDTAKEPILPRPKL